MASLDAQPGSTRLWRKERAGICRVCGRWTDRGRVLQLVQDTDTLLSRFACPACRVDVRDLVRKLFDRSSPSGE